MLLLTGSACAQGIRFSRGSQASPGFGTVNLPVPCGPPSYVCFRTDLNAATVSVPPQVGPNTCTAGSLNTCGNLTGTGTQVEDTAFTSFSTRVTDATTDTDLPHSTLSVGSGGSGDEHFMNCADNRLLIGDTGGREFAMSWAGMANPALLMYTGTVTGGWEMAHAAMAWGHNCPTNQYILYTISNGTVGSGSGYGTKLYSWDFTSLSTAPTGTLLFDFTSSANCLGSSFTATWQTNGEQDQSDTDFAAGFSNNGGQAGPGAVYVAVWRNGSGCRLLNTSTGTVTGDWGPTGAVSGSMCTTGKVHNVKIYKVGGSSGTLLITFDGGTGCSAGAYFWNYTGLTVGAQATVNITGHFTEGLTTYGNAPGNNPPNYIVVRPQSTPGSSTGIIPVLPSGFPRTNVDSHFGWNALNDTYPFFGTTTTTKGQAIVAAWENELLLFNPSGTQNPIRVGHCFITGVDAGFSTEECIASISQDGKYAMYSSNWLNTLGSTTNTATCVPNGANWQTNTSYGPSNINFVNPPSSVNPGNFTFQATTPGTSGTSQPTWPQTLNATVADNTVTWTAIGQNPNCRGDVFIVKLFQ